mmetsp:Transcript_13157/g.33583  ORF Transcript_13157/g.33583 Transcript_13157/m.33583 type:complete len:178 (+) Transcript_13157:133-666(+)
MLSEFQQLNKRQLVEHALNFGIIIASAIIIWKTLMLVSGSESPIVVVLSGSMEPAYYRGDLLFLSHPSKDVEVGDVVVYKVHGRDIPIVHRVLETHHFSDPNQKSRLLTKGDNNSADDRALYNPGQLWLSPNNVVGVCKAFLPYVGMLTIVMNDYPMVKWLVIAGMGLMVLLGKGEN